MSDKRILFTADARFSVTPSTNGGPGVLSGYALVWNQKSSDRGGFKVALAPNSAQFDNPTFALFNHNYDAPLARNDNNTLSLASDAYGVKATIELPNTTVGRDVAELVRSGIVKGMSFGMLLDGASFTTSTDADGDEVDLFTSFRADEVTITPVPAFTGTSVGVAGDQPVRHARQTNTMKLSETPAKQNPATVQELIEENTKQEEYRLHYYAMTAPE
jgi:HK97 family phage prohead protease